MSKGFCVSPHIYTSVKKEVKHVHLKVPKDSDELKKANPSEPDEQSEYTSISFCSCEFLGMRIVVATTSSSSISSIQGLIKLVLREVTSNE